MKKIISIIAITALLFACSNTEMTSPEESGALATEKAKGGKGGGHGGGGGGGELTITTDEAYYVLSFGATSGGEVSKSGGGKNVTERGVCYSTSPNPTLDDDTVASGSGSGTFTCLLSWLDDNTTYYVRAYANKTNKKGVITTTYGNEVTFTTADPNYGTVTDIDGNTYTTIEIGTQVWMMENLKTTTYSDGTPIDHVTDDVSWAGLSSGAYCSYNNNAANVATYGRLYNGYAVDDSRNIAPAGWHVATDDEVDVLMDYIAGGWNNDVVGGKLKEAGTAHWWAPNKGADNSSGFTALPGGYRAVDPTGFMNFGIQGRFWSSDPSGAGQLGYYWMHKSHGRIFGSFSDFYPTSPTDPFDKRNGYAVRCVKD